MGRDRLGLGALHEEGRRQEPGDTRQTLRCARHHAGDHGDNCSPSPEPGQYVVDPTKLPEHVLRFLEEEAESIGLRVTLPSRWGPYLKGRAYLEPADLEALEAHLAHEEEHSLQMGAMLSNLVARLEEHGAEKDDRVGDVLEERGGKWVPKHRPEE